MIPSNNSGDNSNNQDSKSTDNFCMISSNNLNNNQNTNNQPQISIDHAQATTNIDSNNTILLTVEASPEIPQDPSISIAPDTVSKPNCLQFPYHENKIFEINLNKYEIGQNENGFIQFLQKSRFSSSQSIFDHNAIINASKSIDNTNDDSIISNTKSSDFKTNIKLSQKDQIYLTHFYREKPIEFDRQILIDQITFHMNNTNFALAHFQGFSQNDKDGVFLPTVLTERPVNGPLSSFVKTTKLNNEEKFILICGIINGLGFIHSSKGFIHSNLNPTTVYVDSDYHSQICDYIFINPFKRIIRGQIVKYLFEPQFGQSVFQNPLYVAPEILKGEEFDQTSDIYSLGLTIFFILTGKEAILDEEGNITNYDEDISILWRKLVDSCISKDIEKRTKSAKSILLNLLNDENKQDYIDSICVTSEKVELSRSSKIYLKFVERDMNNDFKYRKEPPFKIFKEKVPNIYEIDKMTRLIISAAEIEDVESIMDVAHFFRYGENKLCRDLSWSFDCYNKAYELGNKEARKIVAEFCYKGIGKSQDLNKAKNLYEQILSEDQINPEEKSEIEEIIKDINYKTTCLILKKLPLDCTNEEIVKLFKKNTIKSISTVQEPTNENGNDFQVRVEFIGPLEFKNAKKVLEKKKKKLRGNSIKYEFFKKQTINEDNRFDFSLIPNLININLDDFCPIEEFPKELGHGYYAVTYPVIDNKTGKKYAAKIFKNEINDPYEINSLKREIIMACKFNHIAIVKIVGFNEHSLKNYFEEKNNEIKDKHKLNKISPTILMEFIPNGTIENAIREKKDDINNWNLKWNETTKLKCIIGIANAIAQMFSYNIIHRDLKPLNILLNEKFEPVICDFGYARQFIPGAHSNKTDEIGTNEYIAPEMLNFYMPTQYTYEIDSYSFGIILFQILADCTVDEIYEDISCFQINKYKIDDYKRSPPEGTHKLFKNLINSCWNIAVNERPDPPTIYKMIIDAIDSGQDLLPGANMTDVMDYIERLPKIEFC